MDTDIPKRLYTDSYFEFISTTQPAKLASVNMEFSILENANLQCDAITQCYYKIINKLRTL